MNSHSEEKKFPFPLNVDIEEQVPVKKMKFDPESKEVTTAWSMEKRTTRYIEVPKEKHRCANGEHIFKVIDGGRGIFACTLCPFRRKVYPSTYKFLDGKLIHKITGKII